MSDKAHKPYVPDESNMSEFTWRALVLGLVMSVVLGSANAYLGLRAGMTIAATYPAAVIGMAVLRMMKGSLLEENFARTVGSIGESVAAGAIFTIPAFVILQIWSFDGFDTAEYLTATALMIVGGILGVLFVTVLRRVMVEDSSLPYPESVAAAEIHKAGQRGAEAAMQLFGAMGVGALVKLLGDAGVFSASNTFTLAVGKLKESFVRLGLKADAATIPAGGVTTFQAPGVSPAYLGVGYIIGPELGSLNFAGGLMAWGLFVPLLVFFLGPQLAPAYTAADGSDRLGRHGRPPLALHGPADRGGRNARRRELHALPHAEEPRRSGSGAGSPTCRSRPRPRPPPSAPSSDLSFKTVLVGIAVVFVLMIGLYFYFTKVLPGAIFAALVMLVTGFFFAAVSGNLVGLIGSSNNPISGLTLAATIVAALTMVIVGVKGVEGVAAVLGVAAVVCVSSAVAGEMLQDLKVGHILGGTPWKMQVGRPDRRRGLGPRAVLPALPAAHLRPRQQPHERRLRRPDALGAAGGPDGLDLAGHRGRRDGVAAGGRRDRDGHRPDPGAGQEPDAVLGRHVPAARDDVRDLRRRDGARLRRPPEPRSAATTRRRRRASRTPAS